jgi:hypothetical protein
MIVVTNLLNDSSPGGGGTVGGGNPDADGLLLDFHRGLPQPTTTQTTKHKCELASELKTGTNAPFAIVHDFAHLYPAVLCSTAKSVRCF